jgi:non-ribosomal peptide synthase protein (TIGR01720 family)
VSLEDIVLTGLAMAACEWSGEASVLIDVEGHGREQLFDDVDLSRTVGWFTTLHPVELAAPGSADPVETVHETARRREAIANKGIGYGILAHLADPRTRARIAERPRPELAFNFHGRERSGEDGAAELRGVSAGTQSHPDNQASHALTVDAGFVDDVFTARIAHRDRAGLGQAGRQLAALYADALAELADLVAEGAFVKRVRFASISRGDAAKIAERFSQR